MNVVRLSPEAIDELAEAAAWYTGPPVGVHYIVSTTNPDGNFLEANLTNNTAWVRFRLTRDTWRRGRR